MFQSRKPLFTGAFVAAAALVAGTLAIAGEKPTDPTKGHGDMQLPPGMTEADMKACEEAGKPGKQHEWLQKKVGNWKCSSLMWMTSEVKEPMKSECTETISNLMDGKFIQCNMSGEMPGMGPFSGQGVTGFDNVSKKFVGTWIDSCMTGIMTGTGDQTTDGKTINWVFNANCPILKKPTTMRIVETENSADSMTMVFYAKDKSGKEFKHMQIDMTRSK